MSNYQTSIVYKGDARRLVAEVRQLRREMDALKRSGAESLGGRGGVAAGADKSSFNINKAFINTLRFRAALVVVGLVGKQAFDAVVGGAIRSQREMGKAAMEASRLVAEIRTLTLDTSGSQQIPLTRELQNLSVQFGQTFQSMAKARYDIVSAGFTDAADSAYLLNTASKAAIAGVTEVSVTAKLISSIMRAYNYEADRAEEVSDGLFTTIQKGITVMPELAEGLGRVTTLGRMAGLSLDEVFAAVAALTQAGLNTHEAVTALRAFFSNVTSGSAESKALLDDLGITLDEGLLPVFLRLSDVFEEDKNKLGELFGNIRAATAAAAAGADGAAKFADALDAQANKAGNAAAAYGIMAVESELAMKRIAAAEEVLKQRAGAGYAAAVADGADDAIDAITRYADAYEDAGFKSGKAAREAEEATRQLKLEIGLLRQQIAGPLIGAWESILSVTNSIIYNYRTIGGLLDREKDSKPTGRTPEEQKDFEFKAAQATVAGDPKLGAYIRRLNILHEAYRNGRMDAKDYLDTYNRLTSAFEESATAIQRMAVNTLSGRDGYAGLSAGSSEDALRKLQGEALRISNKRITEAAQGLGIDIADLVITGGGPGKEQATVEAIKDKILDHINTAAKAAETAGIDFDWARVLATTFGDAGSVSGLKNYLDGVMEEAGSSGADKWRKGFRSKLENFSRDISYVTGNAFVIGADESTDQVLERMSSALKSSGAGSDLIKYMRLYGAKAGEQGGAEAANRFLDAMRDALSDLVSRTRDEEDRLAKERKERLDAEAAEMKARMAEVRNYAEGLGRVVSQNLTEMVSMAIQGERSMARLGRAIRTYVIGALIEAAVRATIVKSLIGIAGRLISGGPAAPVYTPVFPAIMKRGGVLRASLGAIVPRGAMATSGMDSVPALLEPGEGVVTRNGMQRLDRVMSKIEASGPSGGISGSGTTVINNFNVARPQGVRDSLEMSRTIVDMGRDIKRRTF